MEAENASVLEELSLSERRLQRTESVAELGMLTAGTAHELKNMLTAVEANLKFASSNVGMPQAEAGRILGLSPGALKVAIHRLRKQFRASVRSEIAQTVDDVRREVREHHLRHWPVRVGIGDGLNPSGFVQTVFGPHLNVD